MTVPALRSRGLAILLTLLLPAACTTSYNREAADRASYALIQEKTSQVPGMSTGDIRIDEEREIDLRHLPINEAIFDFLGNQADSESGARIVNLDQALNLAFSHNRDYQLQRERLYLQALSLTADRYRYTPIFSASTGGNYDWDNGEAFVQDANTLTDISTGNVMTEEVINAESNLGSRLLLKGGGQIALNLTSNFVRFVTGNMDSSVSSALIGSFTQPLLRGAGRDIAAETLMQAERDLLYQLRDFTRYRQTLAVRIASQYYNVLQARDAVRNNFLGLQAVRASLERERAFQAEGLRTPGQVGRLEQSALQRDLSWARSLTRYSNSLDTFKILLGVPADEPVMLDDTDMERVAEAGMVPPDLTRETAMQLAQDNRLDLYTQADRIEDQARKLEVAANRFLPGLDMVIRASVPAGDNNSLSDLDFRLTDYSVGLDLDLPVDNITERNNYRRSLIDYEVAVRAYEAAVDDVKLQVLDAWRSMEEAVRNYEISLTSVQINERRVEEAELRAELGIGNIQDTVDAQNDLINSRTDLTSAVIDHNVAKLELWRDIGLLYIHDNGQWNEGVQEP